MATVKIGIKWGKETFDVEIDTTQNGEYLKTMLFSMTSVPPDRIKLMGLKGGKQVNDDTDLSTCGLEDLAKKNKKLMMMGSTAEIIKAPEKEITFVEDLPEEEQESMSMKNFSPGLTNLGNTCYMNSTIQCLYAVPELKDALNAYAPNQGADAMGSGSRALTEATRDLFNELKREKAAVTPFRFLALLRQLYPQFAQQGQGGVYMQQDAEECWSQIVQTLCREVPAINKLFAIELTMDLKSAESGEERKETKTEYSFKCNITINVNHLNEGFKVALDDSRELHSDVLGRNTLFTGTSKVSALPPYLNVQLVRFYWKQDIQAKSKILRSVTFPVLLDMYEFCTDELKASLEPARKAKLDFEDAEAAKRVGASRKEGDAPEKKDMSAEKIAEAAAAAKEATAAAEAAADGGEGAAGAAGGGDSDSKMEDAPAGEGSAAAAADGAMEVDSTAAPAADAKPPRPTGFYELTAVLTHKGRSADSGHYVGWCKNADGTWTEFDDHQPNPKKEDDILALKGGGDHHMGYLLIYKAQTTIH